MCNFREKPSFSVNSLADQSITISLYWVKLCENVLSDKSVLIRERPQNQVSLGKIKDFQPTADRTHLG
ncbi:hypothetical protein BJP34_09160 [Moorena producens PAL-8-15-08-1]|uniref:Uncharacterized protein n=2 Tax=Moorena TaxID=1155738 RepID=A0A1D8TPW2_9CYAN|nr:hypothetical protein [Moorena producens]AOW99602.1 hypothetical protein BJP34_09160 [Moorena producens PAL-8-15-08-1]